MAFRLITDSDGSYTNYGDDAKYTFNVHGLLVIEDQGRRMTYSPFAWHCIDEPARKYRAS
jgi:hypothetical protein